MFELINPNHSRCYNCRFLPDCDISQMDSYLQWCASHQYLNKKGGDNEMAKSEEVSFGTKNEETGKIEKIGSVILQVPESLDEAKQMWGEDVSLSKCIQAVIIDAQRIARAAEDPDKAQEALASWTPGIARERAGGMSTSALAKKLKELAPDKLKELLEMAGV